MIVGIEHYDLGIEELIDTIEPISNDPIDISLFERKVLLGPSLMEKA